MTDSLYISGNKIKLGENEITFPDSTSLTISGNTIKSDRNDSISLPYQGININGSGINNQNLKVFPNKNLTRENGVTISNNILGFLRGPSKVNLTDAIIDNGSVKLSWSSLDDPSSIRVFNIYVYDSDGNPVDRSDINGQIAVYPVEAEVSPNNYSSSILIKYRSGIHTFKVSASDNNSQEGEKSNPKNLTLASFPHPPTINSVSVAGAGKVSLSWSISGLDTLDSILGFNIDIYNPNGDWYDYRYVSSPLLSTDIIIPSSDLIPGAYTFNVSAINNQGQGDSSDDVKCGGPSEPEIISVTYRSDKRVLVNWANPLEMYGPASAMKYIFTVYNGDDTIFTSGYETSLRTRTTSPLYDFLYQKIGIRSKNGFGLGDETIIYGSDWA